MSSPFPGDQPGPGPHDRPLLLRLLSPSTLPLRPGGWLGLPGLWFSGSGNSLYPAGGYLSCHCSSWDPHCRTFHQPPRGGAAGQLEPGFVLPPLLHSPATSPAGSPRPSSYLSVPSPSFLSPEESLTFVEASSLRFFVSHPPTTLASGLKEPRGFPEGRPGLLVPSLCRPGARGEIGAPDPSGRSTSLIGFDMGSELFGDSEGEFFILFLYVPNFIWWKCKLSLN